MRTSQTLTAGRSTGYGLGLVNGCYRGAQTLHHAGNWLGSNAQMLKVPAAGLDVVVLANRSDVSALALVNRIIDSCLDDLDDSHKAVPGPKIQGAFRSLVTGSVVHLFAQGDQQIASIGGVEYPVRWNRNGELVPVLNYLQLTLRPLGECGNPASLHLEEFGNRDDLVAITSDGATRTGTLAGRYRSAGTGTEVTIFDSEDGPMMRSRGRFGALSFTLECIGVNTWRARSPDAFPSGGILSFAEEGQGFNFSTSQTWALPFARVL
jgi:hypothetical protein